MHNKQAGQPPGEPPSGLAGRAVTAHPLPGSEERWALFLDVDGTLATLAPTPDAVVIQPALLPVLERLQQGLQGALALISGRPLAQLDALFAPLRLPAAGLHGLERRRADGTVTAPLPPPALAAVRRRLQAYAAERPGLLLEDKGASLALHYRLAPQRGAAVRRMTQRLLAAGDGALRLIDGDHVVEFQQAGMDKGRAIETFLAELPFRGRRPVFAGDDTTDEDGFRSVTAQGGLAIKVGDRRRGASLSAITRYALPDVEAMHSWLAELAARLDPAAAERRDPPAR